MPRSKRYSWEGKTPAIGLGKTQSSNYLRKWHGLCKGLVTMFCPIRARNQTRSESGPEQTQSSKPEPELRTQLRLKQSQSSAAS